MRPLSLFFSDKVSWGHLVSLIYFESHLLSIAFRHVFFFFFFHSLKKIKFARSPPPQLFGLTNLSENVDHISPGVPLIQDHLYGKL